MDLNWLVGVSLVGYVLWGFRRGVRLGFRLIILILLAVGLGLAPRVFNLPQVEPGSIIVNSLDLTIGGLCSVSINGAPVIPFLNCRMLSILNSAYGRLPIVLAAYDSSLMMLKYWAVVFTIGLMAYAWDEDVGLGFIMMPYVALLITLLLRPMVEALVGFGVLSQGIYVTYASSSPMVLYTGEAIGYTNSIALTLNPFNASGVVFLWHWVNYSVQASPYVNLPLGISVGSVELKPILNYTVVNCPFPCGGYRVIASNSTFSISNGPSGVTITLRRIINKTSWLEAWVFTGGVKANCTLTFTPDYNYTLVGVGGYGGLISGVNNEPALPESSPVGYIQGYVNAYSRNSTCVVNVIGNLGNTWTAEAPYAYSSLLHTILNLPSEYPRLSSIIGVSLTISIAGAIAGVTVEFLTVTGLVRRILSLLS